MMKDEFEKLAGYEVSNYTYEEIIEPMYLATNLNKADFIKIINRKAVEKPSKDKLSKQIKNLIKDYNKSMLEPKGNELEDKIKISAKDYTELLKGNEYMIFDTHSGKIESIYFYSNNEFIESIEA